MNEQFPLDRVPPSSPGMPQHRPIPDDRHAGSPAPADEELDIKELLAVLRRNIWLIAATCVLATSVAAWIVYTAEPSYRATASLRLLDERRLITGGMDMGAAEGLLGRQTDPLLSQMQVLRSRSVLGEVVDREGLRLTVVEGPLPRSLIADLSVDTSSPYDTLRLAFGSRQYTVTVGATEAVADYGSAVSLEGVTFSILDRPPEADAAVLFIRNRDRAIDVLTAVLRARARERTEIVDLEFESREKGSAC